MGMRGGTDGNTKFEEVEIDPFEILKIAGGWYQCPKDFKGRRKGPLVGYTARDKPGRQLVGEEYVNFAKVEENIEAVDKIALMLFKRSIIYPSLIPAPNVICGVPEGGKTLAALFAWHYCRKYIYPDKEIKTSEIQSERGTSIFIFGRHRINPGDKVIIVEDVVSNFTSVDKLIKLISESGGRCVGVVSFFNRGLFVDSILVGPSYNGYLVPIVSLIRKKLNNTPKTILLSQKMLKKETSSGTRKVIGNN